MSTTSAYFIPTNKFPIGQFKASVKKALEKLSVIDGYYDEEEESYASGRKIVFEYAAIHDNDKYKLIPEASSAGYGATCPSCKADIDEDFYDTVNDYYDYEGETGKEKDMSSLSMTCPSCNKTTTFEKIIFTQPATFANQFFQFVDIDGEISSDLLKQIESSINSELKIINEHM